MASEASWRSIPFIFKLAMGIRGENRWNCGGYHLQWMRKKQLGSRIS